MRVAVITDPPTSLVVSKRRPEYFGGSYAGIQSVRSRLEDAGHKVCTFILLPNGSLVSEEEFRTHALHRQTVDLADLRRSTTFMGIVGGSRPEALVLLLRTETLALLLGHLVAAIEEIDFHPLIFVSTGASMRDHVKELSASFGLEIHFIVRPGVARIPKKGLDQVVQTMGK